MRQPWKPELQKAAKLRYRMRHLEHLREEGRMASRNFRANNPEKVRASHKRWRDEHPEVLAEYARKRRATMKSPIHVSLDGLAMKLLYWGNRCWICNVSNPDCWDHVKPLSKGGLHILANLRPACRSCNAKKHAKWPFEIAS